MHLPDKQTAVGTQSDPFPRLGVWGAGACAARRLGASAALAIAEWSRSRGVTCAQSLFTRPGGRAEASGPPEGALRGSGQPLGLGVSWSQSGPEQRGSSRARPASPLAAFTFSAFVDCREVRGSQRGARPGSVSGGGLGTPGRVDRRDSGYLQRGYWLCGQARPQDQLSGVGYICGGKGEEG